MWGNAAEIGATETALTEGWNLVLTEAGACALPADVPLSSQFMPAPVPGTVAAALERAGQFDRENPEPLNGKDAWYFCRLFDEQAGEAVLRFRGLATLCEVFLNGRLILSSESMFTSHEVPVTLTGGDDLVLCFRALEPRLAEPGPRARWRPQMITPQGLRTVRTTLLGHMPGWCPEIDAVGPWRPVTVLRSGPEALRQLSWRAVVTDEGERCLYMSLRTGREDPTLILRCDDRQQSFERIGDGQYSAILKLPEAALWWPHTHGTPRLHDVTLVVDGEEHFVGRTGFRHIAVDTGADGQDFALLVNGERVFCRGAVWTTPDIVGLPGGREDYARWLELAAAAGMNMIRIGGTMAYETPDFYRLCDELGLLVWQDFMFANFDYPKTDRAFLGHVQSEAEQFLAAVRSSPSLAVLCGGSEIHQQAAMFGLPSQFWGGPIPDEILPEIAGRLRSDVPYVPNSPYGGAMPFTPNAGVTHYYGVGAYCRPLEDARRAGVRFAAESLAFAHVPQQRTLDRHLATPAVHSPLWKARVPRDRGASWDFEDIRDHYLQDLYGLDPARLRRQEGSRYLDFSRAVTAEVIEATYAEWRREGSSCNGALVWTLQDLLPGPGWGAIDSTGEPKPAWYAMRRAFRPQQVILSDEGTNGLDIHVINESGDPLDAELEIVCLRAGQQQVVSGRRELSLAPRTKEKLACTDLFGAFFDTTYAFRFGPPSHDVTIARLHSLVTRNVVSEAFYFPLGRAEALHDTALESSLSCEGEAWFLDVRAEKLAQSVHIDAEGYRPADDWFHLAPGAVKRVELLRRPGTQPDATPTGQIRTLASARICEI